MTAILIAEDDEDVRDLVVFKLEQSGYDVIPVEDGAQALAAAREHLPDVAVLDVSMPGMSGLDVCRLLRAEPATARMLIIMLTARAQESDVDLGFTAGADDYIVKPFSPRELATRLAALLARARR
jgi:DNA-binding response OmpR family regulator